MSQPESIPLQEAIHELRRFRDTDLRAAITEMNDLLATGEVQAVGLVDGKRTEINALWWWASSNFEYPNNSVMFSLLADGEPRPTRATEMTLSFDAWERQKARIAASKRRSASHFHSHSETASSSTGVRKRGELIPVNLAVERYPQNREPMMRIIESTWQAGEITLWGRRKGYAMPEPIREYRGLVISWHAGPPKGQYYAEAHAHPSQPGADYHRHEWEDLAITKADLENLYGSRETDKAFLRDALERAADEILAKKSAEATPKLETTPPFSSANGLPRPTVRDTELRSWYANHIATSQPTSEAVDWEIAQRQFGTKVKREQVRALRRELAPEDWRKQGRRKAAEKSAD